MASTQRSRRLIIAAIAGVATLALASACLAQKTWTQPKTTWGDPDIQGVWPGTAMVGTPLERDKNLGTRAFLTEDEFAKRAERAKTQAAIDSEETVTNLTRCDPARGGLGNTPTTCKNGVSIGPPLYWDDRGKPSKQASLIMDPPDGRIPAFTPEAQKMAADRGIARRSRACAVTAGGCHDSWEDESLWDRCVTRGTVGSIVPNTCNQGNQILQSPGLVVLRNEMIHETRIIPVDGRPHLPSGMRTWMGDSRGHWEGNTLVVETTNSLDKTVIGQTPASEVLKLIVEMSLTRLRLVAVSLVLVAAPAWAHHSFAADFRGGVRYQQAGETDGHG